MSSRSEPVRFRPRNQRNRLERLGFRNTEDDFGPKQVRGRVDHQRLGHTEPTGLGLKSVLGEHHHHTLRPARRIALHESSRCAWGYARMEWLRVVLVKHLGWPTG